MKKFLINFRKSASDRKAEAQARAYNHYRRFEGNLNRFSDHLKNIHQKYLGKLTKKT